MCRYSALIAVGLATALLNTACSCGNEGPTNPDGGGDAGSDAVAPSDADEHSDDADERQRDAHHDSDSGRDADNDDDSDSDVHDGDIEGCAAPGPGCTCVIVPRDADGSCWHTLGGLYGPGACSGGYQCCAGTWESGTESCGPCTCTETTGIEGCVGDEDGEQTCFPEFDGTSAALPFDVVELMTDLSWREGCPVGLEALSLLEMPHWGFDGAIHGGRMVVATSAADDILSTFGRIYDTRFAIERMRLVDHYNADDDLSMADNNTSAFNCRSITGGTSWSEHSYGTAIDINPVQNPYVIGPTVLPPEGAPYVERSDVRMGMVVEPGPVTAAFDAIGWGWGGRWSSLKDYQHFSESGH